MLKVNRFVWLQLPFARGVDALASRVLPVVREYGSREAGGFGGSWLRCTRAPEAMPGHATAVTESTRFAGPALALRPWRVTRRRRRRRGWPWPEARFRPLMARQFREPRTERSGCCVPTGAIRYQDACDRGEGRSGLRASRGRVHSRPSSHRCISSISSTHWTMTRPAAGGTSSSRAPRRTLMSMHRLMALSMVCGSIRWGAAAPRSGTPSAAPLPAKLPSPGGAFGRGP